MNIPVEITFTDKEIIIHFPEAKETSTGNLCIDCENISYDFDERCVEKIIMDKDGWSYPSIMEGFGFENIMVIVFRAMPKGMDNYLKMCDLLLGFGEKGLEV